MAAGKEHCDDVHIEDANLRMLIETKTEAVPSWGLEGAP